MSFFTLLLSFSLMFGAPSVNDGGDEPCNARAHQRDCEARLSKRYKLLKSFAFEAEQSFGYESVLIEGTSYVVTVGWERGAEKQDGYRFSLVNANGEEVATNALDGDLYDKIIFECHATGRYQLNFESESGAASCGGAAVGFKR